LNLLRGLDKPYPTNPHTFSLLKAVLPIWIGRSTCKKRLAGAVAIGSSSVIRLRFLVHLPFFMSHMLAAIIANYDELTMNGTCVVPGSTRALASG
jgi:hypothetical protein